MRAILLAPPLGWVFPVVAAASLAGYLWVDLPTLIWVRETVSEETRQIFYRITAFGGATGYIVGLVLILAVSHVGRRLKRYEHAHERLILTGVRAWYVLLALVTSGVAHHAIKIGLGRARPKLWLEQEFYGLNPFNLTSGENGFPSGRSQTAFAFFVALAFIWPRHALVLIGVAAAIGVSRVALMAHYPSDVLFGAYVGIVAAVLLKRHYLEPRTKSLLIKAATGDYETRDPNG